MSAVKLDPAGFFSRIPLQPHQLTERFTSTADAIVLCHLGVPRVALEDWSLTIGGLVRRPLHLTFRDLLSRTCVDIPAIHECAGSPLEPAVPKRRICNVVWSGVRLIDLLAESEVHPSARFIWSTGSDWGSFGGHTCDAYVKDLPIERASQDVLIAYKMNGEALRPESGYPARLVVPGFYGTNSVKWIASITLVETRATGPFTTTWYNDPIVNEAGERTGETKPVWSIAPESVIVSPSPGTGVTLGQKVEIWGWAWSDGGVSGLDISVDGGLNWLSAVLEKPAGRTWQKFILTWTPDRPGEFAICSRATNFDGVLQPLLGARNAVQWVTVRVR